MEIYVENVKITLTKNQISLIEKERHERKKCIGSFDKMLKHYGFKPSKGNKNCYEHEDNGWWAEIIDHGRFRTVWMVGGGLKHSTSMPGGWSYAEPKEIEEELNKYYESDKN